MATCPGNNDDDSEAPPKDITDPMNGGAAAAQNPSGGNKGVAPATESTVPPEQIAQNDAPEGDSGKSAPPQGHVVPSTVGENIGDKLKRIAATEGDNGYLALKVDKDTFTDPPAHYRVLFSPQTGLSVRITALGPSPPAFDGDFLYKYVLRLGAPTPCCPVSWEGTDTTQVELCGGRRRPPITPYEMRLIEVINRGAHFPCKD